jgi:polysaccharide deacetylase family protein (PEP-CTERM system associated)
MIRVLTFDIEDWFHLLDFASTKEIAQWNQFESRIHKNMDRIFELLERTGCKATFFVLGWMAEKYPEVLKRIDELGYDIGSHSYAHLLLYEISKKDFKADLDRSIKTIEDAIGKKVTLFRAPGFSLTNKVKWVFEELVKLGIETDCSVFPASRGHGGFPSYGYPYPAIIDVDGIKLKEFPINYHQILGRKIIFSGGGYFRFCPYELIKHVSKKSEYIMTYFHPRDFDEGQPVLDNLPLTRRFKSYYGIQGALPKLEKWLRDDEFTDLRGATEKIIWDNVKIFKLSELS